MSRGGTRAERLLEMERLYIQRAFTDMEMAQRLGVDRATVYKDRKYLESSLPFIEQGGERGLWRIDRTRYISAVRLKLHEALALYLAARRASRQTRIAQPHVANGLEKLALALHQPMTQRLVKAAGRILEQTTQPQQVQVLENIVAAWVEQRKVRIVHQALRASKPLHYVVSPYLIEPSLWSDGAYLIGHSNVHNGLATFKIERIEHATKLGETFKLPADFDEDVLLHYAWGIWYGEGEPVTVRLRFRRGEAARRLRESIWHPTQHIEPQPNGDCLWSAQVAEWQEMLPWIRGWGADCEVLEPAELRETLMGEGKALAELYGWFISRTSDPSASAAEDFFSL